MGALSTVTGAMAQAAYPSKPISLVVPYPPGGATDIIGRIMAQAMSKSLGQPVVVENKAGAGTVIGAAEVAQAQADGYTLLISSNTTFTVNPAIKAKLPYDPAKNFESVAGIGSSPLVLLANPNVPVKTVKELVAAANQPNAKFAFGSFGSGTTSHLAGEMFKYMAGVDILHVPYKGSAPAMTDLIGGQIQFTFDTNVAALPMLRAGKVKAIAVTSAQRSSTLPNVPTIAESGYPGYEMVPWIVIVAPRGLPKAVSQKLTSSIQDILKDPNSKRDLERAGLEVAFEEPQSYDKRVATELPLLRAYVHRAKITAD
ncbi:MAG: tripartite tricarboxylate transporter substrate binding protein [Betaproteobacteria bacterium]|nr:tripartite tricarboxylate transporter substrate binding protein [Betaproteobacteria bacterium]NBZ99574.1 tripartite tricarboxylate transporter substrate binding protein [Betaproteobacteria bacterium]NDF78689.1 tripartite tricarboxylate transporter substrate binding protein [Betaproteobacteria bacterium]